MARKRQKPQRQRTANTTDTDKQAPLASNEQVAVSSNVEGVNKTAVVQTNIERKSKIMALTADQIASIYAKRRTKGLYTQFLVELLESGENGAEVKEQWPQLKDKKATTIKQGFENAKEKKDAPEGSEHVDVIVDGEDVFLINSALVRDLVGATADES